MTNALEERLARAGDDLGYWFRLAEGGEVCLFCDRVLAAGEMYDRLFDVVCLDCYEEQLSRIQDKPEERNDEQV